jgi:hypothetical protein
VRRQQRLITAGAVWMMLAGIAVTVEARPAKSAGSRLIPGVCTICPGTFGSGAGTGMGTMLVVLRLTRLGWPALTA